MRRRLLPLVVPVLALLILAGPAGASCDPGFDRQWGLTQVGVPSAWSKATGAGVKIGIVDTGIDLKHEDLASKVVAATKCEDTDGTAGQCSVTKGDAQDDHGHGTHVAGIAAAFKDNGIGVAGVAPEAQLVVAKVLYKDGAGASGSINDINAGIKWVVDRGAKVVNLSLGSDLALVGGIFGGDDSLREGIDYAWANGALPVLASGNENFFGFGSANYGNLDALVVGATGPGGELAGYSSPVGNAKWALVAPGGNASPGCPEEKEKCIFSTFWQPGSTGNVYGYLQGTSMAAPFVSGTAAMLLAQGLSRDAVIQRILNTAVAITDCPPASCGRGRLDAANATGASGPVPASCPTSTPTTKPSTGSTTKTTKKSTTATTRRGTPPTTMDLSETELPTTTEVTSTTLNDDDELEIAEAPSGDPKRPSDDGVNGPLAVLATLGILGAGGTAAPLVWRYFRGGAGP